MQGRLTGLPPYNFHVSQALEIDPKSLATSKSFKLSRRTPCGVMARRRTERRHIRVMDYSSWNIIHIKLASYAMC